MAEFEPAVDEIRAYCGSFERNTLQDDDRESASDRHRSP
jgi:hypothetical protein